MSLVAVPFATLCSATASPARSSTAASSAVRPKPSAVTYRFRPVAPYPPPCPRPATSRHRHGPTTLRRPARRTPPPPLRRPDPLGTRARRRPPGRRSDRPPSIDRGLRPPPCREKPCTERRSRPTAPTRHGVRPLRGPVLGPSHDRSLVVNSTATRRDTNSSPVAESGPLAGSAAATASTTSDAAGTGPGEPARHTESARVHAALGPGPRLRFVPVVPGHGRHTPPLLREAARAHGNVLVRRLDRFAANHAGSASGCSALTQPVGRPVGYREALARLLTGCPRRVRIPVMAATPLPDSVL